MKRWLLAAGMGVVGLVFLASAPAQARQTKPTNSYQRCIKGCDLAKSELLKACDKADTADAKQKCRTLGVKKLEEECYARCKARKGK